MSKIKLKIFAPCINMDEKQRLFSTWEDLGVEISDYKIDFVTSELIAWLSVPEERHEKFQKHLDAKENNFRIISSSRGSSKIKSSKKKKKGKKKHGGKK